MERTTSESDRGRSPPERQDNAGREGGRPGGGAGPVATLHGAVGNQAVKELHERGEIQAKLDVSQPTDASEREAERVADEVVRMGDSGDGADRHPAVTRTASGSSGRTVDGETESRIESVTSGGRPLPESTRSFFEPRFGRDFSEVRVHTGPDADEAARSINAEAFTYGSDVVFRSDAYRPGSRDGRQLLAHELAHVVQQDHGVARTLFRQDAGELSAAEQQVMVEKVPPELYSPFKNIVMGLRFDAFQLAEAMNQMKQAGLSTERMREGFVRLYRYGDDIGNIEGVNTRALNALDTWGNVVGVIFAALEVITHVLKGEIGAAAGTIWENAMAIAVPWAGLLNAVQGIVGLFVDVEDGGPIDTLFGVLHSIDPAALGGVAVDSAVTMIMAGYQAAMNGENPYPAMRSLVDRMESSPAQVFVEAGEWWGDFFYEAFN